MAKVERKNALSELNDNTLMEKISRGDHGAFATLVKKYAKYFYAVAYRYLTERATAEDMTQQAFLKLWESPFKFDPSKGIQFKTWFTSVVVHLCIDYKRKNKYCYADIADFDVQDDGKSAPVKILEKQAYTLLEKSIRQLPISQQTAINLGFYQELPYEEVAQIMKTTPSAVKSLIMRAKENIKKNMEDLAHAQSKI